VSDWRPKQGPARFRGVPFFVEDGERSGGRQVVSHEFPGSEDPPYTEDLGQKGRTFTVEGYVLGTEYETARDALINALESKDGPGELVHPYFGTRRVIVVTFRVRQKRSEGGLATFSIDFRETSARPAAPVVVDTRSVLLTNASAARTAATAQFSAVHSAGAAPADFAVISSAAFRMRSILDSLPVAPSSRAAFERALGDLEDSADIPAMVGAIFTALAATVASSTSPLRASSLLLSLFDFAPGVRPVGSSPARVAEQVDFDAVTRIIQRNAIVFASEAIADEEFTSYNDATAARNEITGKIDQHLEAVADDTFPTLITLRSSLVNAIPGEASDLPRLQSYTLPGTVPSLVLAHRLYGNLEREEDLIRRNRIRNPCFIAGGSKLEVLTDG